MNLSVVAVRSVISVGTFSYLKPSENCPLARYCVHEVSSLPHCPQSHSPLSPCPRGEGGGLLISSPFLQRVGLEMLVYLQLITCTDADIWVHFQEWAYGHVILWWVFLWTNLFDKGVFRQKLARLKAEGQLLIAEMKEISQIVSQLLYIRQCLSQNHESSKDEPLLLCQSIFGYKGRCQLTVGQYL